MPEPPPAVLAIVQVAISGASTAQLVVSFAGAIAWNGVDVPVAFRAFTQDGFLDPPIGVVAAGADWIELESNAPVDPGAAWDVTAAMVGITPAVARPQDRVMMA